MFWDLEYTNFFKPVIVGTAVKEIDKYGLGLRVIASQKTRGHNTGSIKVNNTTIFFESCDQRREVGSNFVISTSLLTSVVDLKVFNHKIILFYNIFIYL